INSGIIELYVMGALSSEEENELIRLAIIHPEIQDEMERVSVTLESYARANEKTPGLAVKPMLMATLNYIQRLENGEIPVSAPALNKNTKAADFSQWINRSDMQAPNEFDQIFVKIISHTPQLSTAIVWLKDGAPEETHTHEY